MTGIVIATLLAAAGTCSAENIRLPPPDGDSGTTVMQALAARRSERAYSDKELPLKTISGLLWAANGFNRPGKRTNATARNIQEISVYACMKSGAYRYDAAANTLVKVCDEDLRPAVASKQAYAATAPLVLVIVADISNPIYHQGAQPVMTPYYDAGIVSGNIYLYCAANSLATVCRAMMDREALKKALKLPDSTVLQLNHPVGFPRKPGS